jgi:hypothetical protein
MRLGSDRREVMTDAIRRDHSEQWRFLIRRLDALEVVVPFAGEQHDSRKLPAFLAVQLRLRRGGSIGDQDFVFDLIHGIGF